MIIPNLREVLQTSLEELLREELQELYCKLENEFEEKWKVESGKLRERFVSKANIFTLEILNKVNVNGISVEFKL